MIQQQDRSASVSLLWNSVVWVDPERLSGVPCFAGTRVPVKNLFDYIEGGDTIDDFLQGFPNVTREQVIGALHLGKERLLANGHAG
jgi:uncharacterized protein (DUF433 family)